MSKTFPELHEDFLRASLAFIRNEIETGLTFARVAKTQKELKNEENFSRNLANAEKAYAEANRVMNETPLSGDVADHVSTQLRELSDAIVALQRMVTQMTGSD